jgi:transketolase
MKEQEIVKIKNFAKNMRKYALETAYQAKAKSSHFGPGMSIVDIVATLYASIMKYDCTKPQCELRDRFILSKGHGVLGYYTALVEAGFIDYDELMKFECTGSYLMGHPVIKRDKGIEFSNGSLGMGLSLGIGVSIAAKKKQKETQTYVIMGDGECNEGSVWEAAMAAPHFKLDNLCCIIDNNSLQLGGKNEDIMNVGSLAKKFESFGWDVVELDGHDIEALYDAFMAERKKDKPLMIVANTIKGKGFSFSENNNDWHHAPMTEQHYENGLKELEAMS